MATDFFMFEPAGGVESGIHFPLDPERTRIVAPAHTQTLTPLERGPVEFPRGNEPAKIAFESFFPGEGRQGEPWAKDWRHPLEYVAILRQWKANGTVVRLLVTDSEITGWDVFVADIDTEIAGGWGDVPFSLALTEAVPIRLLTEAEVEAQAAAQAPELAVPGENEPAAPSTWTVTEEQTLWEIARLAYGDGALFGLIHDANRDLIGPDPDVLSVGMELVIP